MGDEHAVMLLAMGIACFVVLAGWTAAAVFLVVLMNRRVRKLEAETPGPYPRDEMALLYYAVSAVFGMAAVAFAVVFLREARTARQGRTCGVIGVVHMSVIVALTCVGMFLLAWLLPDVLPR